MVKVLVTIPKLPSSPISATIEIDHRLGDAVELGLVDEPFAGIGLGVGVVADDVDALAQRLLQHRRDRHRVVGGEQDAVDALGDVVVDEGDLVVDVGLGRAVGRDLDVAEFLRRLLHALRRRREVADADQLGHVDQRDLLAGEVGSVRGLAAVVVLGDGLAAAAVAGERIDVQIVGTVPAVLCQRGACQQGRAGDERRACDKQAGPEHCYLPEQPCEQR